MENKDFYLQEDFFKNINFATCTDKLTNILNRDILKEYAESLIASNRPFTFMMVDIDNFKHINDSLGHTIGDIALTAVANSLKLSVSQYGLIGRYGGDEFIVIIPDVVDYDDVWNIARGISVDTTKTKFQEFYSGSFSVTIGISRFPSDATDYENLFNTADKALYRGKQKGRNCFIIYLPEKHANIEISRSSSSSNSPMHLHAKISETLTKNNLFAQNIVSLNKFLSDTFMLDHVCIQSNGKIYAEIIHNLSNNNTFEPITESSISKKTDNFGMLSFNSLAFFEHSKKGVLYKEVTAQNITSSLLIEITAFDKKYGYIRADSTQPDGRIWQETDMSVFVDYAKFLGLLLYSEMKTIEQIFS